MIKINSLDWFKLNQQHDCPYCVGSKQLANYDWREIDVIKDWCCARVGERYIRWDCGFFGNNGQLNVIWWFGFHQEADMVAFYLMFATSEFMRE